MTKIIFVEPSALDMYRRLDYEERFKVWAKRNASWSPLVDEVQGVDLKVGDTVDFKNDYDVVFTGLKVIGLCGPREVTGACVFLNKDSFWAPVRPESVTISKRQ